MTIRGDRGQRLICSIYHGLIEETDHVQVPCSCDVHGRCALGVARTQSPEPASSAGHAMSRAQTQLRMRFTKRWIYGSTPPPTTGSYYRKVGGHAGRMRY